MSLYLRFVFLVCYYAGHLMLLCDGETITKSFQVTRASNGTELCVLDPPSKKFNISQLDGALVNIGNAPPKALCGWKCTMDESCRSYNWRDDIQVCEVYYYDPTICSVVTCCAFYQMKTSDGLCKQREPTTISSYRTTSSLVTTAAATSTYTIPVTTKPITTSVGTTSVVATTAGTSTFTIPTTTLSGKFMLQQNFGNNTDFFRRSWAEYKVGFGNTSGDYWMGNDLLYKVTSVLCACSAQFYALNTDGTLYYRAYDKFQVGNEAGFYKLTATGKGGNGSDALDHQNNKMFSTYDNDNDADKERNCADIIGSGWWFGDDNNPVLGPGDHCGKTNLNANSTFFTLDNPTPMLQRSVAYITCV